MPRADRIGEFQTALNKNKLKVLASQDICGICGKPVDKTLKYPNPLSPTVDHIIPIAKGGHPSDIDNLQLAHWTCNRQKSDKLLRQKTSSGIEQEEVFSNRNLPQSYDWREYRFK